MLTPSLDGGSFSSKAANQFSTNVLTEEQLKQMYHDILLIRRVEENLLILADPQKGTVGGAMHPAIGHEANAVGTAAALRPDDYLTCTYRGHHHSLARGMNPRNAIAEVLGRADGVAKGKGGSMHFVQPELGLMSANGIVGAQVPHAAGMALASKLRGDSKIAITFFGEGATFQGVLHETFNMAQKWKLPVIFYCENNRYSEMTPTARTSAPESLYLFPRAYGMETMQIDGNDVEAVYQAVRQAAEHARSGKGPVFIEGLTYRLKGHMAGDVGFEGKGKYAYRTVEEHEDQHRHDPLVVTRDRLLAHQVSEETIDEIHNRVESTVSDAVDFAQNSPWPALAEAYTDVFKVTSTP